MCIASFNFDLNGVVDAESIISKTIFSTKCLTILIINKIGKNETFYPFSNASSSLLSNDELSHQYSRHYSIDKQTYITNRVSETLELGLSS